jgi:hypothetical protein
MLIQPCGNTKKHPVNILVNIQKEIDRFRDFGVNGRIILKSVLQR